jgi:hypothetical protein
MERCSHFGKYEEHKVINSKTNANGRSHWQITDAVIFSEEKKKDTCLWTLLQLPHDPEGDENNIDQSAHLHPIKDRKHKISSKTICM